MPPYLSVIIPAFNEARRLRATLQRIDQFLTAQGWMGEILVIDDGSTDGTACTATEAARHVACTMRLVSNPRNRGKGYSVRRGMSLAAGQMFLISDADLSTPVEEVLKLREAIQQRACVAIGSRSLPTSLVERRQPWYRELMGKTFNLLLRLLGLTGLIDTQCGFKLLARETAQAILPYLRINRYAYDVELLLVAQRLGLTIVEIPVRWINSPDSRVRLIRDSCYMLLEAGCIWLNLRLGRYPRA